MNDAPTMNGVERPVAPVLVPLRIVGAARDPENDKALALYFNRPPTDDELRAIHSLPPSPKIAKDLGDMIKRTMTMEIVARLCRVYVLSGVLRSEGPEVTKWLRRYIDGDKDLGPLGAPLPWPDALLETAAMLREWGFERSPNGWVARAGTHRAPAGTKPI